LHSLKLKNKSTVHSQCLALESRLVFDGAVVATAVEAQTVVNNDHSAEHASVTPTEPAAPTEPTVNLSPDTTPQAIDYRPNANTTSDQPAFPTATDLLHSINSTFVTGQTRIKQRRLLWSIREPKMRLRCR